MTKVEMTAKDKVKAEFPDAECYREREGFCVYLNCENPKFHGEGPTEEAAWLSTASALGEKEETKKVMYKVTHPGSGGDFCVFKDWNHLRDAEFDGAEVGDKITIELIEMTDAEFEELGDFEGW